MKIAGIIRQDTAVGWYRILNPLIAMGRQGVEYKTNYFTGLNKVATIGELGKGEFLTDKTLMEIAKDADIIWTTAIYSDEEILKILDLREWSGAKWIVDIDDDMYNVSIDNPHKSNIDMLRKNLELCLTLADGVTVSTPRLKEVYGHLNPNIFVIKNGQNLTDWKKVQMSHNLHKGVRIGWRGASGHNPDISLVKPALDAISKDFNVKFVTLGVKPNFETEHHEWVGCMDYPETLASLDLDLAIVPLVDSPYNKCKSNIAVQEFGMLKIPVIASPVENQKDMNGVLYASNNYEWYETLKTLIENKKLRKANGESLYLYVKKHHDTDILVKPLIDWMEKLPRKKMNP